MRQAIGPYQIERKLGEGGMGSVFAARRPGGELVALKLLRRDAFLDEVSLQRFGREARALGELKHPNIVELRDMGSIPGVGDYLALEIVEGGSYADRLKHVGRLSQDEAIDVLIGLCAAIEAAHDRGILHRDLKPANVLRRGEQPVLTDFGLVRRQDASQQLTQTGEVLGTPAYMAPEQAGALEGGVSPATDVYGLGATLYAFLTGRPPIGGTSVIDVLMRVGTETPLAPSAAREEPLHPDLDAICLRCLAKQPRDRFASAAELRAALVELKAELAGPPPAARSRSLTLGSLALVALLPLVGLGAAWATLQFVEARARESPTPSPSAPAQAGLLPLVAGISWDEEAFGAPGPDVRAAFERLASLPSDGLDLPAAELALRRLAAETPAQRLGSLSLWAQALRRVSPVQASYPRPPQAAWLEAVVRQLRRAHVEVAARPQDAAARALRGDLWLLYASRRMEDWRSLERRWAMDLHEAYADLRVATRRPLPSPRLRLSTCKRLLQCASRVARADSARLGELEAIVAEFGPLLSREYPSFAYGHVLAARRLPRAEGDRLLQEALDRVRSPEQRAMIALASEDPASLKQAAASPEVQPGKRLRALCALARDKQIDAALALEEGLRIEREHPWVRPLAWTDVLRLLAADRALKSNDKLGAQRALGTLSPSTLQHAPPEFLHRWHSLRAECAEGSSLQELDAALRQKESAAAREAWIALLPPDRHAEQRSALRHFVFTFRKLTPRLELIARRLKVLDALNDFLRQIDPVQQLAQAARSGQRPTRSQLLAHWRIGEQATDPALRAYVFSALCQAAAPDPQNAELQRMIQAALDALQAWVEQTRQPERLSANSALVSFVQNVLESAGPELQRRAAARLIQSAEENARDAPRAQRPGFLRCRSQALFGFARQTKDGRQGGEVLRNAREANRLDVLETGYDDDTLLNAAHLAILAKDATATRDALEQAWALSPPRLEIETSILETKALAETDEHGPEAGLRALSGPTSPPRTGLDADAVLALRGRLAELRCNFLSRLGRHEEALEAARAVDLPTAPAHRARALRSRAFALRSAGRGREAIPLLREALGKNRANRGLVQLELAHAYAQAGRPAHARLAWREGLGNGSAQDSLHALASTLASHDDEIASRLVEGLRGAQFEPEQAAHLATARSVLSRRSERKPAPASQAPTDWPKELGAPTQAGGEALAALAKAGPFLTPSLALELLGPLLDSPETRERWAALAMGLDLFSLLSAERSLAPRPVSRAWAIGVVRLLNLANACVAEQPAPYLFALRGRLWRLYAACLENDYRLLPRAWTRPRECAVIDLRNALRTRPAGSPFPVKLAGESRMAAWDALFRCAQWRHARDGRPALGPWPQQLLAERPDAFQGHVWSSLHLSPPGKQRALARALQLVPAAEGRARLLLALGQVKDWSEASRLEGATSRTRALALVKLLDAGAAPAEELWERMKGLAAEAADPCSLEGWRERVSVAVATERTARKDLEGAESLLERLAHDVRSPSVFAQLWFARGGLAAVQGRPPRKAFEASLAAARNTHAQLVLVELLGRESPAAARSLLRVVFARNEFPTAETRAGAKTLAQQLGLDTRALVGVHDDRAAILQADRAALQRWGEAAAQRDDPMLRLLLARAGRARAAQLGDQELRQRFAQRELRSGQAWAQQCTGWERLLATELLAAATGAHAQQTRSVPGLNKACALVEELLPRAPTSDRAALHHRVTQWRVAAAELAPTPEQVAAAAAAATREAAFGEADPTPLLSLSRAYERSGNPRGASNLAEVARTCPPYWPMSGRLARMQAGLAFKAFDCEELLRCCERGLQASLRSPSVDPKLTVHLVQLQVTAWSWLGRTDDALKALDGIRALQTSPQGRVSWALLRAQALDAGSRTDAALAELRRLGKDQGAPLGPDYDAALAYALERAGQSAEAERAWARFDSLAPSVDDTLAMVRYFVRTWRFELAKSLLRRLEASGRPLSAAQREQRALHRGQLEELDARRKKP